METKIILADWWVWLVRVPLTIAIKLIETKGSWKDKLIESLKATVRKVGK